MSKRRRVTGGGMSSAAWRASISINCGMPSHRQVIDLVRSARGIPMRQLTAASRANAAAALARQIAIYLIHVVLGETLTAAGRVFARDRTTAAHACARVEDQRENPSFDFQIKCLEEAVRIACEGTAPRAARARRRRRQ